MGRLLKNPLCNGKPREFLSRWQRQSGWRPWWRRRHGPRGHGGRPGRPRGRWQGRRPRHGTPLANSRPHTRIASARNSGQKVYWPLPPLCGKLDPRHDSRAVEGDLDPVRRGQRGDVL